MRFIFLLLFFCQFHILSSQCITVDEIPDLPLALKSSGSGSFPLVMIPDLREFGLFNITFTADSLNGSPLDSGVLVPMLIKDSDGTILADFDWVVGDSLSEPINDVGNNWVDNFMPYVTSNPVLTGATLDAGLTFGFNKGEWARNEGYFYTDGEIVLGEWQSGATILDFEFTDNTVQILRLVDCFSSMVGVGASTESTIHAGPLGYTLSSPYLPVSFEYIENGAYTAPIGPATQENKYVNYPAAHPMFLTTGLPDSVKVEMVNGLTGYYASTGEVYSIVALPNNYEYAAHIEGAPVDGYKWAINHVNNSSGASGPINVFDGQDTTYLGTTSGFNITLSGTSPDITINTIYDFWFLADGVGTRDSEFRYQYQVSYAW